MKDNKHIQSFNEYRENFNISDVSHSKLTHDDFLFRLFYFTNPDSEIVYRINDLIGEDSGDIRADWENTPEHIKQEIIGIIKSYILTMS